MDSLETFENTSIDGKPLHAIQPADSLLTLRHSVVSFEKERNATGIFPDHTKCIIVDLICNADFEKLDAFLANISKFSSVQEHIETITDVYRYILEKLISVAKRSMDNEKLNINRIIFQIGVFLLQRGIVLPPHILTDILEITIKYFKENVKFLLDYIPETSCNEIMHAMLYRLEWSGGR
jgi:hypothetical protein